MLMTENEKYRMNLGQSNLARHARKNRYDELFRSWLKPSAAQALDLKVRDMAINILAELRKMT
jgi:hypothetical protein